MKKARAFPLELFSQFVVINLPCDIEVIPAGFHEVDILTIQRLDSERFEVAGISHIKLRILIGMGRAIAENTTYTVLNTVIGKSRRRHIFKPTRIAKLFEEKVQILTIILIGRISIGELVIKT